MKRALLVLSLVWLGSASVGGALADGDPRRDARLLYLEGKFREADALVAQSGDDVVNDLTLRAQLAETAQKYAKGKTGEERRPALEAIKRNYAFVAEKAPENGLAVAGAIVAARELADLDLAKKQVDAARAQATWALQLGEKAAAVGLTAETKAALGEAYGLRASVTRKVDLADQISSDYRKGAQMLAEAAEGHEKAAAWLASAAEFRFREATFLHDSIPLETEKRDDEAIAEAIVLARKACEAKNPEDATFVLHIRALCAAREWKTPGDHGWPIMMPLVPAYEGLDLMVPKGAHWKRQEKTEEWDVIIDRCYDSVNDSSVQIMVTSYGKNHAVGAKTWADFEGGVQALYERRKNGYDEGVVEKPPVLLGGKKGPQVWHSQLAGQVKNSSRRNRMGEWVWPAKGRKDTAVWNLRMIDWRRAPSLEDPDLVAFVASAIGPGLWPEGAAPIEEKDPKGKKPGAGGKKK